MFGKKTKVKYPEKPMIRPSGSMQRNQSIVEAALGRYDWIEVYQRKLAIQAELADFKESLINTIHLTPAKGELIKIAKQFYDEYQTERTQKIQAALKGCAEHENPFKRLTSQGDLHGHFFGTLDFHGFLGWPEIEAAIQSMPKDETITAKDRKSALAHIEKRIMELEIELEKIWPKVGPLQAVDEFVRGWIKIQKQVDSAVGPYGTALKYSSEPEKVAHVKLGIDSFINSKALFRPNDPYPK